MTDNMSGLSQFLLFALISFGVLTGLADAYTTMKGQDAGFKEGNPVMSFLQTKLGFALSNFLTIGVYLVASAVLSVKTPAGAFVFAGIGAAIRAERAVRNYLLVKNAKKK